MKRENWMKILIDAGHGIDTPGKRSPDGRFLEYKWNREVADILLESLRASGFDADLVVKETNDISLRTRTMRVNKVCRELGADKVILVSIHANAAGNGKSWMNAKGWSCYTSPGNTKADALAECLYDWAENVFADRKIRRDMTDGDRDWEANFYMLTKTLCPAVLVENFFYDNREECDWLLTPDAKIWIAYAIHMGIKKYLRR